MSSLLLYWSQPLRLGLVSSHFQQMTKGKTYFIIPPLNCSWTAGFFFYPCVLLTAMQFFLSFPLSSWEEDESIFGEALHQKFKKHGLPPPPPP